MVSRSSAAVSSNACLPPLSRATTSINAAPKISGLTYDGSRFGLRSPLISGWSYSACAYSSEIARAQAEHAGDDLLYRAAHQTQREVEEHEADGDVDHRAVQHHPFPLRGGVGTILISTPPRGPTSR